MLISKFYVYNYARSFETTRGNNSSVTAPWDHILLGFDNSQSFETPRIKNHSVTAPSDLVVLCGDTAQYFENTKKIITVSLYQVPKLC